MRHVVKFTAVSMVALALVSSALPASAQQSANVTYWLDTTNGPPVQLQGSPSQYSNITCGTGADEYGRIYCSMATSSQSQPTYDSQQPNPDADRECGAGVGLIAGLLISGEHPGYVGSRGDGYRRYYEQNSSSSHHFH